MCSRQRTTRRTGAGRAKEDTLRKVNLAILPIIAVMVGAQEVPMARAATLEATRPRDNEAVRPFHMTFPDSDLADLRRCITATRLPEKETVTDASQGVQLSTMQNLARYWATEY